MTPNLSGKFAIVTGAAAGIGRATAVELARAGAGLVIVDVDAPGLHETKALAVEHNVEVRECAVDVSRGSDVKRYVDCAIDTFGTIDALFNNAGIEGPVADIVDYAEDDFDRIVGVNLRGVFLGMKHVLPHMSEQGSGAIVNTASTAGMLGLAGTSVYNSTKAAVMSLTKTAAAEAGPHGVRVNCVCPGLIETRMIRSLIEGFDPMDQEGRRAAMTATVPLGRFGTPEEIGKVVTWLCSDDAGYINGVSLPVDGGFVSTR